MSESAPLLSRAGSILGSIVRHVPTRGALWAAAGFTLAWACVGLSCLIAPRLLPVAAPTLRLLPAGLLVAVLGAMALGVHGLHRGAARAALDIEGKLGLVRHVVRRVFALLEPRIGAGVADLPLGRLEEHLLAALDQYLGSDDLREGAGLVGWVLRRAKRAVAQRIRTVLLSEYRAEATAGGGGGVSLPRLETRIADALGPRLADIVMSPLDGQRTLLLAAVTAVSLCWLPLLQWLSHH